MQTLNLPPFETKTRIQEGKNYIYDRLRKQYVRLTPEESVRQHFVHFLINFRSFPEALLANEIEIQLGNVKKRCDSIAYNNYLQPIALIEYKSPSVKISQQTFDQIIRYNMALQVPWLIVSNGINHYCCKVNLSENECSFVKDIPYYQDLVG